MMIPSLRVNTLVECDDVLIESAYFLRYLAYREN